MGNFYTDVIKQDHRFGSTDVINDLALLEPTFRGRILNFISYASARGHSVRVAETYRSQARQTQLWEKKLTELKTVGVHGFGLAADLAIYVNGKYDPNGQDYMFFVEAAKQADELSGINWGEPCAEHGFKDYDHLQGVPLALQPALFAGTWYPSPGFDPWAWERAHGIKGA